MFGLRVGSPSRPPRDGPLLSPGISSNLRTKERRHVANIKSQIKRNKTNEKARERNKAVKSELRTEVRRTREAVAAGDKAAAEKALAKATKKLDKAVALTLSLRNGPPPWRRAVSLSRRSRRSDVGAAQRGAPANGSRVAMTVTRRSRANTGSREAPFTSASARAAA